MKSHSQQHGYFLILAVIFILVMGLMGSVITYLFSNRAMFSAAEISGLKSYYMAESGLEIGARLLTMPVLSGTPARVACNAITGTSAITNATFGSGKLTITATNSVPTYATTTLSSAITSSALTISVSNASSFASNGRVMIDGELINYAAISGNSFIGVTRGVSGTTASSHASGAGVGQYQCSLDVQTGIPTLTSPSYQRELQWDVQLQEGWVAANRQSNNFVLEHWNRPSEIAWSASTLAAGSSAVNLMGISMLSQADGWAVGLVASSNLTFLHWTGSAWQLVTVAGACSTQSLFGVSMVSSQEGWAIGDRYRNACAGSGPYRYNVVKWNGSSWTVLTPSTSPALPADNASNQNLNAVHVIDTDGNGLGNIGFAVGDAGVILRYNGTSWAAMTSPTTRNLTGVYVVSASEAWAVGASGTILRYNGSSWSTYTSPGTTAFSAIAMLDSNGDGIADLGWIAAASGRVISYNGSTWSLAADIGSNTLNSVAYYSADDVWAVGAGGTALHWDGSSWASVSTGTTLALNGISVISPGKTPVASWNQVFH